MAKCEKLLEKARASSSNLRFEEACKLAECHGFTLSRQKGSHRIYKSPTWPKILNFQEVNGKAKDYQVEELLEVIDEISMEGN